MRARNIKPGFYRDADLSECSVEARYITPGLWMMADREGRLKDNPRQIKMELFPCDSWDCEALLDELVQVGHIIRYEVEGVKVIQVRKFIEHQNPHKKEAASVLPGQNGKTEELPGKPSNYQASPADVLIPDSLIPDSLIPEKDPLSAKPDDTQKKASPKNRNGTPPYQEIIEYLNEKTGKAFKPQAKETQRHIKARWNAGFGVDAFRQVIDNKVAKWATDPKMADYLRPETLFGTKFESYLNEQPFGTQDDEPTHPSHRILTRSDDA